MTASSERTAKAAIVEYCQLVHRAGWVANHDGNLSIRIGPNRVVATPTAEAKRVITEKMVIVVDLDGKQLSGGGRPFSELALHLVAYRTRPDISAVLHAHPITATAGVSGQSLMVTAVPEVVVSLGAGIPTAPLCMPKTPEADLAVANLLYEFDAIILAGNGALTVGDNMEMAFLRMELLEHFAGIIAKARQLGDLVQLPDSMVEKLLAARAKAGLGPTGRADKKARWSASPTGRGASPGPAGTDPAQLARARAAVGSGPAQSMATKRGVATDDPLHALISEELARALADQR